MGKASQALLAIKGIYDIIHKAPCMQAHEGEAWAISEHLYNEGYRKLKDKLPLLSELFARLCNPAEGEIQGFDWVLSREALEWLYELQSNDECKRIVWSLIKSPKEADIKHYEEG